MEIMLYTLYKIGTRVPSIIINVRLLIYFSKDTNEISIIIIFMSIDNLSLFVFETFFTNISRSVARERIIVIV